MVFFRRSFLSLCLFCYLNLGFSQSQVNTDRPIQKSDFTPYHSYLSSDRLEGREVGTDGSDSASAYIVKQMIHSGLLPFFKENDSFSYFQPFDVLKQSPKDIALSVISGNHSDTVTLNAEFAEENGFFSSPFKGAFPCVFCGYGIESETISYNDYETLDVKGKVVLVLDRYPGHWDTASLAFQRFHVLKPDETIDLESKIKTAEEHGASCIILIKEKEEQSENTSSYLDARYYLLDGCSSSIPCLIIEKEDIYGLLSLNGSDLMKMEGFMAKKCKPSVFPIKRNTIVIDLGFDTDTIHAKNIAGKYPGKDSSHLFIVGAHYDHLGKRGSMIYNGADDNASGASGVLCLAKVLSESGFIAKQSVVFACWDAEEKGLLGSRFFVDSFDGNYSNITHYINMDMISRSAPEDTLGCILSIGTRPEDDFLRQTAERSNSNLTAPFTLDLWDVTGHSGSDYGPFKDKHIPVMTFFSGFHDDYHSPADVYSKVDSDKMLRVLRLVYGIMNGMLLF